MSDNLVERLLVGDIPVYRFYDNSREAVDTYMTIVNIDIQAHIEANFKPMFYVIDISRSGMFSVNYTRQKVDKLMSEQPQLPIGYIAYVTDNSNDTILINLIASLTAQQFDRTRKIFKSDEFNDAIAWLSTMRKKELSG